MVVGVPSHHGSRLSFSMVSVVFAAYTSDSVHRSPSSAHSICWPIAFRKLKHTCSPPKRKMTFSNLGFAHTISLPLLYKGWSAVIMVCFWPVWFEMSTKRLITVVSVSLSSAGACRMGSITAVVTGGINDTGCFIESSPCWN